MSKPTIQIHNIETNEIIERDMNAEELAKYNESIEAANNMKAEAETKALQRQALLSRLGISEEEARILLG